MTPKVLLRILGATLWLVIFAASVSAQTKSATWMRGTWEGTGYQIDDKSTWTMVLKARRRSFVIDYPSLNCGGRWRPISIGTARARFVEKLDHGQDKCADNGKVIIQRLSGSQILFLYSHPGTREVIASAVLNKRLGSNGVAR